MVDLQNAMKQRFPLLTSLRLFHSTGQAEDLAAFMGVLLAAMEASHESSFCFVFPQKSGIAQLTATLYALGQFASDFPKLAEHYAQTGFKDGQRVRLVPEDKVFVFGGVWQGLQGLEEWFRLKLLDDKRHTKFNWPTSEILRIEPTTRKIPKGREEDIHTARRQAPLSTLDKLIGTRTFGNPSLAVNYVLYLGGRAEIDDFFATTSLSGPTEEVHSPLDLLVVPGVVNESGEIKHQDNYQAAGQPLIAISSRLEHIEAACKRAERRSKVVVVDGAKRITDLARFDSIAESQNLIIVSEPDEEEKLQQLYDRGCKFWRFSLADLEMGGSDQHNGRFFNRVFRSASNEANFETDVLACRYPHLEEVARSLVTCKSALDESEEDETQLILKEIYRLLVHCTGLLAPPETVEQTGLRDWAEKLSRAADDRMMWLPEVAAEALKAACLAAKCALEDPELGKAKGNALKELLGDLHRQEVARVAIVARSAPNSLSITRWLENEGLVCPVLLPTKVAESGFFERLICTAWPGSPKFGKLVQKFSTPRVHLLAYPFESQWLYWFGQKHRNNRAVPGLTSEEKSRFLGLSSDLPWPQDPASPINPSIPFQRNGDPGIDLEERMARKGLLPAGVDGEETIPARLISFSGDAYAFLTDNFHIPVITDLVSGEAGENYRIPRRRPEEIQSGDVLVFRESGPKDVIQSLADAQIGPEAAALRELAARWHRALRESGHDETTLMAELRQVNCPRTLQTVRGWLADDSKIGPQTKDDLEAIAYAAGDQQLLNDVSSVWAAIHRLRGEHLSAGVRLSRILLDKLPERLDAIQEGRTRIEIDNATSAWVVQVESISDRSDARPRSYVNALLWDTGYLFEVHPWQR